MSKLSVLITTLTLVMLLLIISTVALAQPSERHHRN